MQGELAYLAGVERAIEKGMTKAMDAFEQRRQDLDTVSFRSPTGKQYEDHVNLYLDDWLSTYLGLEAVADSRRGIASTDPAAEGIQWDARLSVRCVASWAAPPPSDAFIVYGSMGFGRPDATVADRKLSPLRPTVRAQYLASLEFTRFPDWTSNVVFTSMTGKQVERHSLLTRIERRLNILRLRFKEVSGVLADVLDLVAVVGVVGEYHCRHAVEDFLSKPAEDIAVAKVPLLKRMYDASRFVFFYCLPMQPVAPSVPVARGPSPNEHF